MSPVRTWAVLALGEVWNLAGQVICADSTDGSCLQTNLKSEVLHSAVQAFFYQGKKVPQEIPLLGAYV